MKRPSLIIITALVILTFSFSTMAQAPSHKLCVNGKCVYVEGEGTDTCRNDEQCSQSCEEKGGYCCETTEFCQSEFVSPISCGVGRVCCPVPCTLDNESNQSIPSATSSGSTPVAQEDGKVVVSDDVKIDQKKDEIDMPFIFLTILVIAVLGVVLYQSISRRKPSKASIYELEEKKKLLQNNIEAVKDSFLKRRITEAKANEKIADYEQEMRLVDDQLQLLKKS